MLLVVANLLHAQSPKREMRAVWIATVANIDWPSKEARGSATLQQQDMLRMLDSIQALHLNTIVFQVRPTADALYKSELEPWSSWLTGKQGKGNDIEYDPLAFVCREAHRRCIDVHVWLNPYRVTNQFDIKDLSKDHIYHQHPEWFVKYGKQWYFNPGLDETRQWLNRVVADIVDRYDVDAIHFDDYFYPYRIQGEEFPDADTFRKHPRGFTDQDEWRRNNVNMVIQELQQTIKSRKPWVEFGISPFGVWRNASTDPIRGSQTKAGCQNYDDLYADILLWLEKGWIDYVAPQLYWEIGKKVADHQILAHWWAENSYGRQLYTGQAPYLLGNPKGAEAWRRPNEVCRQIALNRSIPEISGQIFYPIHSLLENPLGLCDSLRHNYYAKQALPPITPQPVGMLSGHQAKSFLSVSLAPTHLSIDDQDVLHWLAPVATQPEQRPRYYVVYAFPTTEHADFDDSQYIVGITADTQMYLPFDPDRFTVCVTTINQWHAESLPATL